MASVLRKKSRIGIIMVIIMLLVGITGCADHSKSSSLPGSAKKSSAKEPVKSAINKQAGLGDNVAVFEAVLGKGIKNGNTYSFKEGSFVVEFVPGAGPDLQASKITINHNPPVSADLLVPITQQGPIPDGLVYDDTEFKDVTLQIKTVDLEKLSPGISSYLPLDYLVNDNIIKYNKKLHVPFGTGSAQCSSSKLAAAAPDKNGQFYVSVKYDKTQKVLNTCIGKGTL